MGKPGYPSNAHPPISKRSPSVFLYNEEIIQSIDEIASLRICDSGDHVDVWLHHSVKDPETWRRTSGCTGGFTTIAPDRKYAVQPDEKMLSPSIIHLLTRNLIDSQDVYRQAGGIHTSALSNGRTILTSAEDIGRHNTFDKLCGQCLMHGIQTQGNILLTTGRISSEMMQKAARKGVSTVISRTSPTSASIELTLQYGVTLIGYARQNTFNIYTYPQRVSMNHTANAARSDSNFDQPGSSHPQEGDLARQ